MNIRMFHFFRLTFFTFKYSFFKFHFNIIVNFSILLKTTLSMQILQILPPLLLLGKKEKIMLILIYIHIFSASQPPWQNFVDF